MFDTVITSLFQVGLSLQAAIDLPPEMTGPRIAEALGQLDDTIREIRVTAFASCDRDTPPHPAPRHGTS